MFPGTKFSIFNLFLQKVDGCVVVNPERLAKGLIGGTYARLIISPNDVVGNIVKV